MGSTERRARQKESLRNKILEKAMDILIEDGLGGFSIRRIAKRIEYSPTTIYLYFRDKSDLLLHLCEEVYRKLLEAMQAAISMEAPPLEKLKAAMRAYIHFGISDPNRYRIAFMTPLFPETRKDILREGSMAMTAYETFHCEVSAALEGKPERLQEAEAITQALWAGAHGLISLVINFQSFPLVETPKLVDTSIDLLIAGLMHAPSTPPPSRKVRGTALPSKSNSIRSIS